jgi:UDP-N-acetylmuramate: L-alanyl-gamma-D-glutamyl-meso-diaminopimelate ligase
MKRVYLSGIGGIGMANVAVLLKQGGFTVSGSDANIYEPAASVLREAGIVPQTPYCAENIPLDGTPIIIGNALSRGNPEVEAALNARAPLFSFPEYLCRNVLTKRQTIVVAGTHGKSTTTACIAHLLQAAGHEPGFLVGAQPLNFPFGAQWGREEGAFVIEGDEYDTAFFDKRSKFLHYFPQMLVLGTIEYDHADIFPSLTDMLLSYTRLLRILPQNGTLIYNADSEETIRIAESAACKKIAVGASERSEWRLLAANESLSFRAPDGVYHSVPFCLSGKHNRLNALMSVATACSYGAALDQVISGIRSFRGLKRRLEKLFERSDLIVYDDFAHHPTAIHETLRALRETYPDWRLIAVIEPRSNTMVRNVFQKEFAQALAIADEVVIGTIHRSERIPFAERLDLKLLESDLTAAGVEFAYYGNKEIPRELRKTIKNKTIYIFMSNGSFDGCPAEFIKSL